MFRRTLLCLNWLFFSASIITLFSGSPGTNFSSFGTTISYANSHLLKTTRTEAITQGTLLQLQKQGSGTINEDVKIPLFDAQLIGELITQNAYLFFLVDALPCEKCKEERAIYLVRLSGAFSNGEKNTKIITHFVQPGKVLDPKTSETLLDSRAFFGNCLANISVPVYVSFQKEKIDKKKKFREAVYVATPGPQFLNEKIIERRPPPIKYTLSRVKTGECKEITARNRMMLQKPLDLKTRNFDDIPDLEDTPPEENPDDESEKNSSDKNIKKADT